MKDRRHAATTLSDTYQLGVPLESALARREKIANQYDIDFGQERVFPELVDVLMAEVPEDANVLEVGAATGLLTRPLLGRAGHLTALEPSSGLLKRLLASDVAESPHLTVKQGMVEDLLHDEHYDVAVVTFTPRRGVGLNRLLVELASRVHSRVIMLLDDDGSLDWAYLARGAATQGFDVTLHLVVGAEDAAGRRSRAVVLVAGVARWVPSLEPMAPWDIEAREIEVPFPTPRGAATRLVRYFMSGGDRALRVTTDPRGSDRLYGNLRTAVHRLAREEMTVRRHGDAIHIVRLPREGRGEATVPSEAVE